MTNSRKFFIDCGYHKGEIIEQFKKSCLYDSHWHLIGFEANPELRCNHFSEIDFINSAISTKDGTAELFTGDFTDSSSLIREKKTGNLNKSFSVRTIDFSKWLLENFTKGDFIIISMNIEGSEYAVLNKMIQDGSANLISILLIEFHNEKVGIPVSRDRELIDQLSNQGVFICQKYLNKDVS